MYYSNFHALLGWGVPTLRHQAKRQPVGDFPAVAPLNRAEFGWQHVGGRQRRDTHRQRAAVARHKGVAELLCSALHGSGEIGDIHRFKKG